MARSTLRVHIHHVIQPLASTIAEILLQDKHDRDTRPSPSLPIAFETHELGGGCFPSPWPNAAWGDRVCFEPSGAQDAPKKAHALSTRPSNLIALPSAAFSRQYIGTRMFKHGNVKMMMTFSDYSLSRVSNGCNSHHNVVATASCRSR